MDEMKRYYPCKALQKYKGPLLVVHGTQDEKIDYQHVKSCFDGLTNRKKKFISVKGTKHGFHEEPYESQVVEMLVEFFK